MSDKDQNQEISLELNPEIARGTYSNLAIISHSHSEFIIDFATMLPGIPKPDITNRIIMTPEHAKRLLIALKDNIDKYEAGFGNISLDVPEKEENISDTFNLETMGPMNGGNLS